MGESLLLGRGGESSPAAAGSPHPPRILVADDEPGMLRVMKDTLEMQGFSVRTALDGEEALAAIRSEAPDIAVVDLKMPRRDGFGVCRALREDPRFEHLPVIILSGAGTRDNKVEGLDLGADDFVSKPVDFQELLARIRTILRRARRDLDANPLTHLPGNASIQSRIEGALAAGSALAVLYVDLNQFKAYNDAYGYDAGDRVIRASAGLLLRLADRGGGTRDFVGHIGGDDFILLTDPGRMEALARSIVKEFDRIAPGFHNERDLGRGRIVSTDRQGRVQEFPLLSVSIGICHNENRRLLSYAHVAEVGAELKKHAKSRPGSSYVIDRRT